MGGMGREGKKEGPPRKGRSRGWRAPCDRGHLEKGEKGGGESLRKACMRAERKA